MTNAKLAVTMLAYFCTTGTVRAVADEPKFEVVLKRADDKVDVTCKEKTTTFSVRSPFGIGHAVVSRVADDWPERVMLRLHLKGLENLRIANEKMELTAERSEKDNKLHLQIAKNKSEKDLLELTKLPEIRMIGSDGKSSTQIPLEAGYFEVLLPKVLFESKPKSISISWIDFYR